MNSKRGAYVYVKSPVNAGKKKSRLVSQYFDNSIKCLKFSYRVTGAYDEIGLKIYQQAAQKSKILRWSQSNIKTSEWLDGEVTMSYIKSSSNYRIIVEGVFETYSYGEIDIRKLSLKSGSCYNGSSKSAKNIGIIIGSVGAALILFIVVIFLIYYFCYKKYKRNSTANLTKGVMNQVSSSYEDTTTTDLPPPSFESVCNLPPAYTTTPLGKVNLGTEAK
ncbi:uncharacterized protein LOC124440639 isoform X2 [Xenia sp. Carnegie-2017]|uniref:uncharacterized protein LOC124440639 isoform X2 n=1 Tax=Xenia sp. Carnegie-2017 TaxID=2897299 RepID=UPI001F04BDD5|nr:uncharacterized protein LOC124440639 isoform X2 [Xenia sp. Carnegie-2017]